MKYLAETIVQYISQEAKRQSGTLRFILPSYSSGLLWSIGLQLEETFSRMLERRVDFQYGIAYRLGKEWQEKGDIKASEHFASIKQKGWHNEGNNLTSLRNRIKKTGYDCLVTLLAGYEHIDDRASLQDFFQLNQQSIWELCLKKSFNKWISARLERIIELDDNEAYTQIISDTLTSIYNYGLADLEGISRFLETRDFSGISSGYEAYRIILGGLEDFGLPCMIGMSRSQSRTKLTSYISSAQEFFNYHKFVNASDRKKALKKVEAFRNRNTSIPDEEELGPFSTIDELLDELQDYIQYNRNEARQRLLKADFVLINDKILGFREKGPVKPKKPAKIKGLPPEVFLHAIWLTLGDLKKAAGTMLIAEELRSITLRSTLFRHDFEDGDEADDNTKAKLFLLHALGGIDEYLERHLELELGDRRYETSIDIYSMLGFGPRNEALYFQKSSTAEPYLKFEVTLQCDNIGDVRREYLWILPQNHQFRLLVDLYLWAVSAYAAGGDALPVFAFPYLAEVFQARDEEEVGRLLNTALQSGFCSMEDLLKSEGIESDDPVKPLLAKLALSYQRFLQKFNEEGFFTAIEECYTNLRIGYCNAALEYLEKSSQSTLGPFLFKAFMIVPEQLKKSAGWGWDRYLRAGVLTPLHPALLDMIFHQNAYLFECFSYYAKRALEAAGEKLLADRNWERVVDLARIQWPVFGTLQDTNQVFDTSVQGFGYIHLVGKYEDSGSFLNARLLMEYDDEEDEEINDTDLFRSSQASDLIKQVLKEYRSLHSFAQDGISIGAYCGGDIQPIISGIDAYLAEMANSSYTLQLTIVSDSRDDSTVVRWINAWKERWQQAELSPRAKHYANCRISVVYRVICRSPQNDAFKRFLKGVNQDVMFFMDFIDEDNSTFTVLGDEPYPQESYRKFPILEKVCCRISGGGQEYKRQRVLSNYRFRLGALHAEIMAHLKNPNSDPAKKNAVISVSDFQPWIAAIDAAHKGSAWVVCIDPAIDEYLLYKKDGEEETRDIIGFGTGVGSHGENNFTVSTEQFSMNDIQARIAQQIGVLLHPLLFEEAQRIAESLMREAINIAGLSLVKATGPERFVREFIANTVVRKLLPTDKEVFCDTILSLDAFFHWFEGAETQIRPDILRLKARINDGIFSIDAQIVECKLAQQEEGYLGKARQQIESGLRRLVACFKPREDDRPEGIDENTPPDRRYWWMQLHRLIASKGETNIAGYQSTLIALERLSEGFFEIHWQAAVVAFWIDSESDQLKYSQLWDFALEDQEIGIPVITTGKNLIKRACLGDDNIILQLTAKDITFYSPALKQVPGQDNDTESSSMIPDEKDQSKTSDEEVQTDIKREKQTGKADHNTEQAKVNVPEIKEVRGQKGAIPERILIGTVTNSDRKIYWEFGHRDLPNRHILILGSSGTGKTYTIQALLSELGMGSQNSLIVDYTNGFTSGQLDPLVVEKLKPQQHWIRKEPLTVNPFRQQVYIIDDMELEDTATDVAERVTGVFSEVYNLGDQQKTALYDAIRQGVNLERNHFNLPGLLSRLEDISAEGGPTAQSAKTVVSRLKPFIDTNPFGQEEIESWEKLFTDPIMRCHIMQLAGYSKDTQRLITEFAMYDLYWYYRAKGNQDKPRVIVLDEVQNLDQRLDSPMGKMLTEGRKFGISLVLATQTLSNLGKDERDRLFQASHKLFFRPADTELRSFAQILSDTTGEKMEDWVKRLGALKRGECYSLGYALNENNGRLEVNRVFKLMITSLEKRF